MTVQPAAQAYREPTASYTPYQAKFFAYRLTQESLDGGGVTQSLSSARVDLNPHQVDAAMFAMRSPVSKGALLADEVGLGKTIEAALVMAQRWWERRRRLLLVTPASLRKQWAQELHEKFSLPTLTPPLSTSISSTRPIFVTRASMLPTAPSSISDAFG